MMFNWFRELVSPSSFKYDEGPLFVPRWGFCIPHTLKAKGAWDYDRDEKEYDYWKRVIRALVKEDRITHRNGGLEKAFKRLKDNHINASIEPHFNSFNGSASGCEVLVLKGDHRSIYYAELFIDTFKEQYPNKRIRQGGLGIKYISKGDRGYKNLKIAKKYVDVTLLTETFFGDNVEDYIEDSESITFFQSFIQ